MTVPSGTGATARIQIHMMTKKSGTPVLRAAAALMTVGLALPALADFPATLQSHAPELYLRLDSTAPAPVEPPAANLGSTGAAGVGNYIGSPTRGLAGAIAGDSDTSITVNGGAVSTPWNAAYNPSGSFTVEAWFKPGSLPGGLTCPLSAMRAGAPRAGWLFYQLGGGTGWNFRMFAESGTATSADLNALVTLTEGAWYHVVATYDGTTARLYVNGVEGANANPTGYVATKDSPLVLGARSDLAFAWNGGIDEVAIYPTALSASDVQARFNAGTGGGNYVALVQSGSPLLYQRVGEAPIALPVADNSGSTGDAGDGRYLPGTTPGVAGPVSAGLPASNKAAAFNGSTGIVRVPGQALSTAEATILGWIWRDGTQLAWSPLLFRRGTGAPATGFGFGGNGTSLAYHWNDTGSSYNFGSGLTVPDREWTFVALTVKPEQAILYMGTTAGLASATNNANHDIHDFDAGVPIEIGRDPTGGRIFKGRFDEVALLGKALTGDQIQALFNAGLPALTAVKQSPADPIYEGLNVNFDAVVARASGSTATYQWYRGAGALSGQTGARLTLPGVTPANAGDYSVVAKVGASSLTSAPIRLEIVSSAPVLTATPQSVVRFVNGTTRFSAAAIGTQPISYSWRKGADVIPGATGPVLEIQDLQASDAGEYTVTVSNALGTKTASATLTLATPTAFAAAVVDAGPVGYWRLNEAAGSTNAFDYWGGRDGNNKAGITAGAAGPTGAGFPGGNTAYTLNGATSVDIPALNLNTATATFVGWIRPNGPQDDYDGLIFSRGGNTVAGLDFQTGGQLGYHWNDAADTYNWGSGLTPADGAWNFVALVVEPTKATIYLDDGTGLVTAVNEVNHGTEEFNGVLRLGADSATGRQFNGSIDEVAVFDRALGADEIARLQAAGRAGTYSPTALSITASPRSATVLAGTQQALSGRAAGSVPIRYQWRRNGSDIPGAIRSRLAFNPAEVGDTGVYELVAKQGDVTRNTTAATLTVKPVPSYLDVREGLVLHLPFDGGYGDTSGRGNNGSAVGSPAFTAGRIGSGALRYNTTVADGAISAANYVSLGTPADLAFGSGSFSVAFWTKFTGQPGDLPFLCNNTDSFGGAGFVIAPSWASGSWSWSLNDGASPASWPGFAAQYGNDAGFPDTLNNGQWHHVVHVIDRNAEVTTFVDGAKVHAKSIAGLTFNTDTGLPVTIGQGANGDYAVAGSFEMDDLGVWRRALTEYEAMSIFIVGNTHGRSFDVPAPAEVVLTFKVEGGNLVLGWTSGTLEGSTSVTGPWLPVSGTGNGAATITPDGDLRFFRVKQ